MHCLATFDIRAWPSSSSESAAERELPPKLSRPRSFHCCGLACVWRKTRRDLWKNMWTNDFHFWGRLDIISFLKYHIGVAVYIAASGRPLAEHTSAGPRISERQGIVVMEKKKVLIIGGVACGAKTAARLARLAPEFDITILERGEHLSVAGCGFPYFVGDVVKEYKDLVCTPLGIVRDANFFRNVKNIAVHGTPMTRIDRRGRRRHEHRLGRGASLPTTNSCSPPGVIRPRFLN